MTKRRITLTLDEDLVDAIQQSDSGSISAAVNKALREAVESENHRKALLAWMEELNEKHGRATPEEQADNEAFLDEIGFGDDSTAGRTDTAGAA